MVIQIYRQKNLNQITENKEKLDKEIVELKSDNNVLHNNLNQVAENNKELDIENKDLKDDLNKPLDNIWLQEIYSLNKN